MDNIQEIWKEVVDNKGYFASSLGRFSFGSKILTQYRQKSGYVSVCMYGRTLLSHRIIAECFHDNTLDKPCVHHINEIRWDNRALNLEWVTRSENIRYSIKNRAIKPVPAPVKVRQLTVNGEFVAIYESMRDASRSTGIQVQRISEVVRGKFSQSKGFVWELV